MKMKRFYLLAAVACLAAAVGCDRIEQNGVPEAGKTIRLHIEAQAPEISKTTLSDDLQLVWEGTEKLGIIFGNESSSNAATSAVVVLPSTAPGVFEGEVAIPSGFTANDIKGVAYPAEGAFFKYQSGQNRIVTTVPTAQTQASEGKLNGKNTPVFAVWDASKWEVTDGTYSPVNLSLDMACSIIRFNIYGELEGIQADEKVQSLVFVGSSTHLCGTAEYRTGGSDAGNFTYNGKGATMTLDLDEPALLSGRTQASPLVLYMGVLGRGMGTNSSPATITSLSIITDKATYKYSPEGKTISPMPGSGYPLGLNLAKFTRVVVNYSVDGGTTWADAIPTGNFTTLAVKGNISASTLADIKTAIDAQEGVALDLSEAVYESETFPAVFGGTVKGSNATASAAEINEAGSPLTSVKFPSNVKTIAASAFCACDKLTSVDLTGLVVINGSAFMTTGLTSVTIPATLETCSSYAFAYCPNLATIAWNNTKLTTTHHVFSWRGAGSAADNVLTKPTTVTIAAGANFGTGQCFDTNHKVVKVIFEGNPSAIGSAPFIRCTGIGTFDVSACTAEFPAGDKNNLGVVGDDVTGSKVILVPAGTKDAFAAKTFFKHLVETKGYVLQEVAE